MKKLGFTLSELLITLGIIGVAAALVAPAVTNLMPDKNKMMFIKNYNELVTITEKMLNDKELYYPEYEIAEQDVTDADGNKTKIAGRKYPTCVGLECADKPIKAPYNTNEQCEGTKKYIVLLADYLGSVENDEKRKLKLSAANAGDFGTTDGTFWQVLMDYDGSGNGSVTMHVNNSYIRGETMITPKPAYNDYTYKTYKGKTFKLKFDKYGKFTPSNDYLAQAYLLNKTNMNNKKRDIACFYELVEKQGKSDCSDLDD